MIAFLIALAIWAMFLSLVPPVSAQETFEETHSSLMHVDKKGDASFYCLIEFPPSRFADALKTYCKSAPEAMKSSTLASLASSFAHYGWETRNARCEIAGLGAGEKLKLTVTCKIPHTARWSENRWTIYIEYINPEEAAQWWIDTMNAFRALLFGFGTDVRYIESGELAFILPEKAVIVNRAELENFETHRIEYGGGSYMETSLYIGEREGKPAVAMGTHTVITTENITITPQGLAQELEEAFAIEYTGVSPPAEEGVGYLIYIMAGALAAAVIVIAVLLKRR